MKNTKLAFVILTWNSEKYIKTCIESVLALRLLELKLYVVDNGSNDLTIEILKDFELKYPTCINAIFLLKNYGTTKTRNIALKAIEDDIDWICILDSDTIVNQNAFDQMIQALLQEPKALLAAPRMWNLEGNEQLSCKRFPTMRQKLLKVMPTERARYAGNKKEAYDFFPSKSSFGHPPVADDKRVYKVDYAISACWLMKKQILTLVGYLDERIFYAPEDVDYCKSIWEADGEVLFVSGASIYHDTQRISKKKFLSKHNALHLLGLIYYFLKHSKFKLWLKGITSSKAPDSL